MRDAGLSGPPLDPLLHLRERRRVAAVRDTHREEAEPAVERSWVATIFTNVVLPAPFGPRRA